MKNDKILDLSHSLLSDTSTGGDGHFTPPANLPHSQLQMMFLRKEFGVAFSTSRAWNGRLCRLTRLLSSIAYRYRALLNGCVWRSKIILFASYVQYSR